jgi:hypothetical protein
MDSSNRTVWEPSSAFTKSKKVAAEGITRMYNKNVEKQALCRRIRDALQFEF